jgi:nicotinamidase/pyrazinamidase
VKRVFVCGLATDYCVKHTALDAQAAGFETIVIADASAAVNITPDDEANALDEVQASGVHVVTHSEIHGDARLRV